VKYHFKTVLNWINPSCLHARNYVAYNAASEMYFSRGPPEIRNFKSNPVLMCLEQKCFELANLTVFTKMLTRSEGTNSPGGYFLKIEKGKEVYASNILPKSRKEADWDISLQPKCEKCGHCAENGEFGTG
jgi:hypothetical protein